MGKLQDLDAALDTAAKAPSDVDAIAAACASGALSSDVCAASKAALGAIMTAGIGEPSSVQADAAGLRLTWAYPTGEAVLITGSSTVGISVKCKDATAAADMLEALMLAAGLG